MFQLLRYDNQATSKGFGPLLLPNKEQSMIDILDHQDILLKVIIRLLL